MKIIVVFDVVYKTPLIAKRVNEKNVESFENLEREVEILISRLIEKRYINPQVAHVDVVVFDAEMVERLHRLLQVGQTEVFLED